MVLSGEKQRLRRLLRSRRAALAAAQPDHAARLAGHAGAPEFSRARVIAGYSALPGEADVALLMVALEASGHRLALPRVNAPEQPLSFHEAGTGAQLARGAYGILEPTPDAPLLQPDLVLVPLLGFDALGGRLGYGGGYYDRTLFKLRAGGPVVAVGVAFAGQLVEAVPVGPFDQALDAVLTEEGVMRFG